MFQGLFQGHGWADDLPGNAPFRGPTAGLSQPFRENPCFCSGKRMCHVLCTLYVSLGWHMSFAVLSPAFRGLQFPFRDMYVLTFHLNSFTGNNGRPSHEHRVLHKKESKKESHIPSASDFEYVANSRSVGHLVRPDQDRELKALVGAPMPRCQCGGLGKCCCSLDSDPSSYLASNHSTDPSCAFQNPIKCDPAK